VLGPRPTQQLGPGQAFSPERLLPFGQLARSSGLIPAYFVLMVRRFESRAGTEQRGRLRYLLIDRPYRDRHRILEDLNPSGQYWGSEAMGGQVAAPIAKAILVADRAIRRW